VAGEAVIADLDGTLCDVSEILHLVEGEDRNFHAFHAASAGCPSVEAVVEAVRAAKQTGRGILIVTGREFIWRDLTLDWLAAHDIPYDELVMRIVGDYRPDDVIKAEMLDDLEKRGWTVAEAWEDRDDIAELWESRGITVHRV
jgi:beta-phosphoglucomutase-like phosphatase (HAD superfamily)